MQFALLALAVAANAENIAVVLNSDIKAHLNDYLSVVQAQTGDAAQGLLSLYAAGQTYTDDSYTTLVDSAEYASLSAFATALPWYSERLESQIDAGAATSTEASESSAASTEASESSAATSSAAKTSSAVETTSAAKSTTAEKSSSASEPASSTESSSSHSVAGANALVPGALAGAFIGALALI